MFQQDCADTLLLCVVLYTFFWTILALVLGAIWGVLFVKARLRMPSHSFLVRALLFSFAVWLVLTVSPGWSFLGAKWVIPRVSGESNLADLVGLLLWGFLFQFVYRRQRVSASVSQATAPIYESNHQVIVKGTVLGLVWVIDLVMILILFFSALWNLSLQLFVLTVIVLLFTGKKKMDELS